MADFTLGFDTTTTTTPAITYAGADSWTVNFGIYAYSSNADAVFSDIDGSILINNGNIHSGLSSGVVFLGGGQITNNAGHNIVGVHGIRAADGQITNHGTILGLRGDGIQISTDSIGATTVTNDGYIFGRDAGIRFGTITPGSVTNSGNIVSDQFGIRIENAPGATTTITNSGTITADLSAIFTVSGNIDFTNAGKLIGAIVCTFTDENDKIVNKGAITGEINLGGGNDLYDGRLGSSGALFGSGGDDTLLGGKGKDTIEGDAGKDTMTGGRGADKFVFINAFESAVGTNHDLIKDFSHQQHDKIDLHFMDADSISVGNQDFHFIGTAKFHGVTGELHIRHAGHNFLVEGDLDADKVADFQILVHASSLVKGDFIL